MKRVRVGSARGQEIDPPTGGSGIEAGDSRSVHVPERRPSGQDNGALILTDAALDEQRPYLRRALRGRGVRGVDLDDMVQETVIGAWLRMKSGGFQPAPDLPLVDAFRVWLSGVALRQASHYRDKAYRRREVLEVDPNTLVHPTAPSPEGWVAARGLLRVLEGLGPELGAVLGRTALGLKMREIARELGLPQGTVATRLRLARRLFARILIRRRGGVR